MNNEEYGRTRFGSVIVSTYIIDIPGFVIFHLVISFFAVSKHLARTSFSLSPRSNRYTCTNAGLRASSTSFTWLPQKKRDDRINISHTDFSWSPTSTSSPTPERCSSYHPFLPLRLLLPPSPPLEGRPSMRPHRIRVRTTEHLIVRLHCGTCIEALPVETSLATI